MNHREVIAPQALPKVYTLLVLGKKDFHGFVEVLYWPARRDSNPRPSESESAAISSFATGGYRLFSLRFALPFEDEQLAEKIVDEDYYNLHQDF